MLTSKKMLFVLLFLVPWLMATTYVIQEGGVEVGRWVEKDGKDGVEVVDAGSKKASVSQSQTATAIPKANANELFRPRTEWLVDQAGHHRALQKLKQSPGPFVIYFHATWCPYCKTFNRDVLGTEAVEHFLKAYVRVRVDGDKEKGLMKKYGATGYPTFYVFSREGKKTRIPHDLIPEEFITRCRQAGLSG